MQPGANGLGFPLFQSYVFGPSRFQAYKFIIPQGRRRIRPSTTPPRRRNGRPETSEIRLRLGHLHVIDLQLSG
jgi:hypothetical protein